eukprot:TRINITY_DN17101_c0_g1_i1.p1 TRINITY_DN17101_c0_g1~~TRINITY_DN17101_c0_g1_i1.p1  ORF type:complete len:514 (-),score=65.17 TRINITY_DN17101_c0_g1_i1:144-1685(-)
MDASEICDDELEGKIARLIALLSVPGRAGSPTPLTSEDESSTSDDCASASDCTIAEATVPDENDDRNFVRVERKRKRSHSAPPVDDHGPQSAPSAFCPLRNPCRQGQRIPPPPQSPPVCRERQSAPPSNPTPPVRRRWHKTRIECSQKYKDLLGELGGYIELCQFRLEEPGISAESQQKLKAMLSSLEARKETLYENYVRLKRAGTGGNRYGGSCTVRQRAAGAFSARLPRTRQNRTKKTCICGQQASPRCTHGRCRNCCRALREKGQLCKHHCGGTRAEEHVKSGKRGGQSGKDRGCWEECKFTHTFPLTRAEVGQVFESDLENISAQAGAWIWIHWWDFKSRAISVAAHCAESFEGAKHLLLDYLAAQVGLTSEAAIARWLAKSGQHDRKSQNLNRGLTNTPLMLTDSHRKEHSVNLDAQLVTSAAVGSSACTEATSNSSHVNTSVVSSSASAEATSDSSHKQVLKPGLDFQSHAREAQTPKYSKLALQQLLKEKKAKWNAQQKSTHKHLQ